MTTVRSSHTSFTAVLFLFALAGCATTNEPGTTSYAPVASAQIIGSVPRPPESATATVVVKRDPGFMGAALTSILTVDGKPIARIRPGQFISLKLPTGEHIFGVASSDNLGPVATNISREVAADCNADQSYYFRLFPQVAGGIVIDRVSR